MNPSEQTENRRRSRRKRQQTSITLRIPDQSIEGNAESCTGSGALFHTDLPLTVEIQFEEDGVSKTRTGRLIRTERVSEARQSWAVEFDPS